MVKYCRAIAVEEKRIKIGIPKGDKIVYMNIQKDFNNRINDICIRIRDIKMQQNKSRNHYKKYYCC